MNDLITVTNIDNEPRVLDTDLAAALGYAIPAQIRRLIGSHEDDLKAFGPLITATVKTGGRPATAYYLNKPQAVFLTTQAGTPTAVAVTVQVIQKFDAYERGLIQATPQLPDFTNPAEAARAWATEYEQRQITEQRLAEAIPKVEFYDNYSDASGLTNTRMLAKTIGRGEREFVRELLARRILHRSKGGSGCLMPNERYKRRGYFEVKTTTVNERVQYQTLWTPKGVQWAAKHWGREGVSR